MESTYQPILHVEDDENDILLFQRALAGAGVVHPIQVVRNGIRALDYLLGRSPFEKRELYPTPSLILLDLSTPLLGGLAVLKWRQTYEPAKRIPTVVLTSSQQPEDIAAAYQAGANSYLVKPLTFDGWMEMVKAIRLYWFMHNTFAPLTNGQAMPQIEASFMDRSAHMTAVRISS
jgi:CheY-like chemotaxis protein